MTVVDMGAYYRRMAEWHHENDPGKYGRSVFFYLLAAEFADDCKSDPLLHRHPARARGVPSVWTTSNYWRGT